MTLSGRIPLLVCLALLAPIPALAQPEGNPLVTAPFLFRGTILRDGSPQPYPRPGDRTVTVRVDEIFRGAATVGDFTGQEIAVDLLAKTGRKEALIAAVPTLWGKTVAVRELAEFDVPADSKAFRSGLAEQERQEDDRKLLARLASAEAVIAGKVMGVERIDKKTPPGAYTEHDPEWMLAHIGSVRTLKGRAKNGDCGGRTCVDVVFSGSRDIMWFGAPKLHEGDQVILLLRRDDPLLPQHMRPPRDEYILINPADLRAADEEQRIRELLKRLR
jgi:hypothetical protein